MSGVGKVGIVNEGSSRFMDASEPQELYGPPSDDILVDPTLDPGSPMVLYGPPSNVIDPDPTPLYGPPNEPSAFENGLNGFLDTIAHVYSKPEEHVLFLVVLSTIVLAVIGFVVFIIYRFKKKKKQ
ncbi:MAG: hypothetical protein FWD27_08180 [Coriobacteriia bacterium]|nr:hypothetical protein [Coriobacteriia bacterium]